MLAVRSFCRKCLSQGRSFSSTASFRQLQHDLPSQPPSTGYSQITNRALISVQGPDSTSLLQGLLTQSVINPQKRSGFYAAFLNAPGRVLNDVFVYPTPPTTNSKGSSDPGYLIEVDEAEATNLLKHLKKHKLRSKLSLRALDKGELSVWALWNDESGQPWTEPENKDGSPNTFSCIDSRAPGFGSRLLAPEGAINSNLMLPGQKVPLSTYKLRRILHGIAEGQGEIIRESALPMECNMDMMHGIDFHKGCYVGQELTIRTHHTGVVRKRILPVQLYDAEESLPGVDTVTYSPEAKVSPPPTGADISKVSARKGRSAGKFLSGVGNVGLALCRLEMMTDISLTEESSQYDPAQEFKVAWDADTEKNIEAGQVKLKALVPPWTREFILSGGAKNRS